MTTPKVEVDSAYKEGMLHLSRNNIEAAIGIWLKNLTPKFKKKSNPENLNNYQNNIWFTLVEHGKNTGYTDRWIQSAATFNQKLLQLAKKHKSSKAMRAMCGEFHEHLGYLMFMKSELLTSKGKRTKAIGCLMQAYNHYGMQATYTNPKDPINAILFSRQTLYMSQAFELALRTNQVAEAQKFYQYATSAFSNIRRIGKDIVSEKIFEAECTLAPMLALLELHQNKMPKLKTLQAASNSLQQAMEAIRCEITFNNLSNLSIIWFANHIQQHVTKLIKTEMPPQTTDALNTIISDCCEIVFEASINTMDEYKFQAAALQLKACESLASYTPSANIKALQHLRISCKHLKECNLTLANEHMTKTLNVIESASSSIRLEVFLSFTYLAVFDRNYQLANTLSQHIFTEYQALKKTLRYQAQKEAIFSQVFDALYFIARLARDEARLSNEHEPFMLWKHLANECNERLLKLSQSIRVEFSGINDAFIDKYSTELSQNAQQQTSLIEYAPSQSMQAFPPDHPNAKPKPQSLAIDSASKHLLDIERNIQELNRPENDTQHKGESILSIARKLISQIFHCTELLNDLMSRSTHYEENLEDRTQHLKIQRKQFGDALKTLASKAKQLDVCQEHNTIALLVAGLHDFHNNDFSTAHKLWSMLFEQIFDSQNSKSFINTLHLLWSQTNVDHEIDTHSEAKLHFYLQHFELTLRYLQQIDTPSTTARYQYTLLLLYFKLGALHYSQHDHKASVDMMNDFETAYSECINTHASLASPSEYTLYTMQIDRFIAHTIAIKSLCALQEFNAAHSRVSAAQSALDQLGAKKTHLHESSQTLIEIFQCLIALKLNPTDINNQHVFILIRRLQGLCDGTYDIDILHHQDLIAISQDFRALLLDRQKTLANGVKQTILPQLITKFFEIELTFYYKLKDNKTAETIFEALSTHTQDSPSKHARAILALSHAQKCIKQHEIDAAKTHLSRAKPAFDRIEKGFYLIEHYQLYIQCALMDQDLTAVREALDACFKLYMELKNQDIQPLMINAFPILNDLFQSTTFYAKNLFSASTKPNNMAKSSLEVAYRSLFLLTQLIGFTQHSAIFNYEKIAHLASEHCLQNHIRYLSNIKKILSSTSFFQNQDPTPLSSSQLIRQATAGHNDARLNGQAYPDDALLLKQTRCRISLQRINCLSDRLDTLRNYCKELSQGTSVSHSHPFTKLLVTSAQDSINTLSDLLTSSQEKHQTLFSEAMQETQYLPTFFHYRHYGYSGIQQPLIRSLSLRDLWEEQEDGAFHWQSAACKQRN